MLEDLLKQTEKMRREKMPASPNWSCQEDIVLKFGRFYEPQQLPKSFRRGRFKACFRNSALQAFKKRNLIYVEGYALLEGLTLPTHHAWLVERGSTKVIDRTLLFGSYFGIPFRTEYVRERWKALPEGVSLLDDWESGFPLFQMNAEEIQKLVER